MVCENNVDTWRRAAFCEETGETYKRVIAVCLRPLKQFASKLGEGLDSCSVDKSVQLGNQLRLPTDSRLDSRLHELFYDFQLCAWCARIDASLTAKLHKDQFGVAQLSGSNSAFISTLLSCMLAVETLMGKLQSSSPYLTGPDSIKWVL
ncbi:uncharacterized protein LOC130796491 [Actinidia eriantha]|uniref:uncharacterized protein LOC130796491 n=1 Tax=Actinidia eriantha TaxID=165200 RepID=UPI002586EBCA|nr:uncharacterized protein LOC130796491 [Actinidia eriantha]